MLRLNASSCEQFAIDSKTLSLATQTTTQPAACSLPESGFVCCSPKNTLVSCQSFLSQAAEQGIWVSNIPSSSTGNALSCAEHAIYLMLATLRQQNLMSEFIRRQRVGVPVGETLFGKSVLIIGFGNIAKELISRQGSCIAYWS